MNKYAHGELFGIFKQAFLETTFALNKEKSTSKFWSLCRTLIWYISNVF